ncbi:MAG: hypothetical protein LBD18_06980 [Treponema sp.]|jgi:hypothetical protein|nr:hypothetical protein [Treponema sp.]
MKQLIAIIFIALFITGAVFSQEKPAETTITIGGELKTGLFWYDRTQYDADGEYGNSTGGFIHNGEDTDWAKGTTDYNVFKDQPGRFRLNFQVDHGNIGTKFRFEAAAVDISSANPPIKLSYAFAYGYFLNRQVKISAGKMGDSPWGTGGPEMWRELDTRVGLRFELIPAFLPFIKHGQLNLGMVLNDIDSGRDSVLQTSNGSRGVYFYDLMKETVVGLSYYNDWFLLRGAYRLDSEADGERGEKLIYRVEERALRHLVPGLQIFANGYVEGLNSALTPDEETAGVNPKDMIYTTDWLYIQYAPEWFTTQLRMGISTRNPDEGQYYIRASFYYNLFNNLISIGPAFEYAQDYGPNMKGIDGYLRWYIEPMVRFNFASGSYAALVYRFQNDVETWNPTSGDNTTLRTLTNWVNFRVVLTF